MTTSVPPLEDLVAAVGRRDPADPLDRVGTAVSVADELGSVGDRLVTHFVGAARDAGCSWAQIGAQLGVSKQAAQQGHAAPATTRRFGRRRRPTHPFGRFTDQARATVVVAQEEARGLHHGYIGTEHLLLGLLADADGVAGTVLRRQGADVAGVRAGVPAGNNTKKNGHLPMTKRAKEVLAMAAHGADGAIGTEHILLALIDEGHGLAARVLVDLGVDLPALRAAVLAAQDR